jgi:hypothetical protein
MCVGRVLVLTPSPHPRWHPNGEGHFRHLVVPGKSFLAHTNQIILSIPAKITQFPFLCMHLPGNFSFEGEGRLIAYQGVLT